MNHEKSDVLIYQTTDYSRFCMISGNRGLIGGNIKKIIKEIESGNDMIPYYPILVKVVGDRLEILEGQHRYFICSKLSKPVYYVIIKETKTMSDIARINSNTEKWTPQNYINCYINKNNDNYIRLQAFLDTYGINIGTSLRLLSNGTPGAEGSNEALKDAFEKGKFKINHWDKAVELAETCKLFGSFEYWRDRGFIIAVHRIKTKALVPIELIRDAFIKYPDMLIKNFSHKEYAYNLEQIVNKNKQHRIVII